MCGRHGIVTVKLRMQYTYMQESVMCRDLFEFIFQNKVIFLDILNFVLRIIYSEITLYNHLKSFYYYSIFSSKFMKCLVITINFYCYGISLLPK